MITDTVSLFSKILPQRGRVLGLDLGAKRIGIAISDPSRKIASPLYTLQRTKFTKDASKIKSLCHDDGVKGLIIGLPINMDGSSGKASQSIKSKANKISKKINTPISLWDERLSTVGAFNLSSELDINVSKRTKNLDGKASAFMLQGAIDYLNN